MKRLLAFILSCALVLQGCTLQNSGTETQQEEPASGTTVAQTVPEFDDLSNPDLQRYLEDKVYSDLVSNLDSDNYFVENVEAKYVSKEYLEELAYNSQENVYFGYNLTDLESQLQGTKYVFAPNDDGQTVVKSFEAYDDTYDQTIRNVAIGTGVILICVTVTVVTAGAGAPAAVTAVFAASAETGTVVALSSAVFSGTMTGIITGLQTNNMDEAVKSAALSASEGFMWGAITGVVTGGIGEGTALFGATRSGLTFSEASTIQQESKYPLDLIKQFKSTSEYQVYKEAGLRTQMVGNRSALVRDIDLNYTSELGGKTVTNLERMQKGYAPLDPATGKAYQLHHIGQRSDGTIAILTEAEHQGNSTILNTIGKESEIDREAFDKIRGQFWKDYAASLE